MSRPLLAVALVLAACSAQASSAGRAIWIWESASYAMVQDRAAADQAIAFAHAQKIDTLYLYADTFGGRNLIVTHAGAYRRFISRLHQEGLRAYALLGSAFLHTEAYVLPGRRAEAVAMFRRVLDYNAAATPVERFDGINLDIEPHILAAWDTRKLQLLAQYLDLADALMNLKHASGQTLEVGPAIPFWLDGITLEWHGRTTSVAEHVLGLYDYAALMDYRDHAAGPDGIISHAVDNLEIARRLRRRLVIGIDVTPGEPQKVSFDHLGAADLERELGLVEAALRDDEAFGGFAIHHYSGYRAWLARAR